MNEQLKIIISAEVSKLKQNVENAKKSVSDFQAKVKEASKNVDDNFKKMGTAVGNAAKTIATGIGAAFTALLGLAAATTEYREQQALLASAFEQAGGSAAVAKDTYNDLYRVLGDGGQATEAAQHLAKLTTEEKALSEWTNICQGVYATFGASLPIESLTEAANETAKTGELTGALADALNWAGVSEDAFSESLAACATEAEREALIRDTLNGLYSDAAATYETNNAQILAQRDAQAQLQETMATLGEVMQPVVTAFTAFGAEALAIVTPYIQSLAEQYLPLLQEILTGVASALEAAFTWVSQHKEVLAVLAAIIGGIAAAIGLYNVVAAVKAAMDAAQVTTLAGLAAAYIAQAAAMAIAIAPYVLIVAAIAAVIAIIVTCIKNWDKIKETVSKVWNSIKQKTQETVNNVVNKFNELKDKAKQKIEDLKAGMVEKFNSAKTTLVNTVVGIKDSIVEKFTAAKDSVFSIFENLKNGIKDKITAAKDIVKGIIDTIKGFFNFSISWPKIPMPHFGISPSGWKIGDLLKGSIPKLSINWYATGGVFDSPTLFSYGGGLGGLGENGAEAVVPLEHNTQWLDRIATMLADKMGGGTPITLTVDGKVFAQTAISTINSQTRQTGKLALNIV